MNPRRRWLMKGLIGSLVLLGTATLYFSWIPDPRLTESRFLPSFVSRWADAHDQLRTAVPMVAAGFLAAITFRNEGRSSWRKMIAAFVVLSSFILFVEAGQLLLPRRSFDWMDVAWGVAGSALGLLSGHIANRSGIEIVHRVFPFSPDMNTAAVAESSDPLSKSAVVESVAHHDPLWFMGVRFWNADAPALLGDMDRNGGMLTVPSAPSLAQMADDPLLKTAYQTSEWAVVDGGYVALVLRALGRSCKRISGHQLIERLLDSSPASPVPFRERRILWVIPSSDEGERISSYLGSNGFNPELQKFYLAPFYRNDADFDDTAAKQHCDTFLPDWIVICLGGGRQEKLGWFLRKSAKSSVISDQSEKTVDAAPSGTRRPHGPVILCTGAAIAFFTGGQARIPRWADRLYLGWLLRIASGPKTFFPRYFKALWHFPLALYRERGRWFEANEGTPELEGPT